MRNRRKAVNREKNGIEMGNRERVVQKYETGRRSYGNRKC